MYSTRLALDGKVVYIANAHNVQRSISQGLNPQRQLLIRERLVACKRLFSSPFPSSGPRCRVPVPPVTATPSPAVSRVCITSMRYCIGSSPSRRHWRSPSCAVVPLGEIYTGQYSKILPYRTVGGEKVTVLCTYLRRSVPDMPPAQYQYRRCALTVRLPRYSTFIHFIHYHIHYCHPHIIPSGTLLLFLSADVHLGNEGKEFFQREHTNPKNPP
jgi:hypothetical protein